MRWIALSILIGGHCAVFGADDAVVPVYREPRHRLVLESGPVRVLDVRLAPGETSLYHLHTDPILYVAIDISEIFAQTVGEAWRRTRVGEWRTGSVAHDNSSAEQPLVHRIRNVGSRPFRLVAVTNSGPPAPLRGPDVDVSMPGELEAADEWFRQSRVTLAPGTTSGRHLSPFPVVIVAVSPGQTETVVVDGKPQTLNGAGGVILVEPRSDYELRNPDDRPAVVVVIEAR